MLARVEKLRDSGGIGCKLRRVLPQWWGKRNSTLLWSHLAQPKSKLQKDRTVSEQLVCHPEKEKKDKQTTQEFLVEHKNIWHLTKSPRLCPVQLPSRHKAGTTQAIQNEDENRSMETDPDVTEFVDEHSTIEL